MKKYAKQKTQRQFKHNKTLQKIIQNKQSEGK